MNRNEFERDWNEIKGEIRIKWNKFTSEDIARVNGKYEQFMNQLQKKYSFSREEANREIENWHKSHQKKETHKNYPQLPSEQKPSDLQAHEALLHEDTDSIYPYEPPKEDEKDKKRKPI